MKHLSLLISVLLVIFVLPVNAQSSAKLNDPIPVDPQLKKGILSNGLRYYIRENKQPEKRISMRLVVNAGSVQETDQQQGLAHFTEHMCFNGTKNFEKNELIDFLEKMGIKFGADLNAYTSFAETVYMLQLPTDDEELVNKGFQVLEDWAHNVSFAEEEVDKERGVIKEEWRLGLGARDRMMKDAYPVIFKGSRYAERIPIGKVDIIDNFEYSTLTNFYNDWYRPDLMSVVVVGDLDPEVAEKRIKEHFSNLENPKKPKKRKEYDLPPNEDPLIAIETDKEATSNTVMLFYKHERDLMKSKADYRRKFMEELYNGMLNQRLSEIAQKPEAPFMYASTSYGPFLARTSDAYTSYASAKESQIDESLETLLLENERIRQHGFTATEFERQREQLIRRYEKKAKESDKTESSRIAGKYVRNFLSHAPVPGSKNELIMAKELVPTIKLSEINRLPKQWITRNNMAVMIMAPEEEGVEVPDKKQVLNIIEKSRKKRLKPYEDKVSGDPLLAEKPKSSKLIDKGIDKDLGVTYQKFENGVSLYLKPTDFKNDEVLFSAYSPGGHSLYGIDKFISAYYSDDIISQSGVGQFDNTALKKKLSGKIANVNPYIDELKEGFNGSASPEDLETMFKLIYLYFTEPRKDTSAFEAFKSKNKNQLKYLKSNPQYAFYDTLYKVITQNDPRTIIIPSMQQIEQVNHQQAYNIYKDRFADAGDFTFFLVGNFDVNTASSLAESYLGGLPTTGREESWKDVEPDFPESKTEFTVEQGIAKKGMVGIAMGGKFKWKPKERMAYSMMKRILSIKLRERVREDEGGTYGVSVRGSASQYPEAEHSIMISFGCSPERADELSNIVFEELDKLRKDGPADEDIKKVKQMFIRDRETRQQQNRFWLNQLENTHFNGEEVKTQEEYNEAVNSITAKDIKKVARRYLDMDNYVKGVLLPGKEN
ncbi:MAG: insulinase family protein [Bacteroidales bacterium]|nr:insulinase family protein [Bacteroidales bacterium]